MTGSKLEYVTVEVGAEILRRLREKGRPSVSTAEALVSCYERADEAIEALEYWWPQLEQVLHDDVIEKLKEVSQALESISRVTTGAAGGADAMIRLIYELDGDDTEESCPS